MRRASLVSLFSAAAMRNDADSSFPPDLMQSILERYHEEQVWSDKVSPLGDGGETTG